MIKKILVVDWGSISYTEAWNKQEYWFNELVEQKEKKLSYINRIIFCQHPHVYTLGRSGKAQNMLLSDDQLKAINATLYHIDRGGDITYHGPGQLVCYPIINLADFNLGLKQYIHLLEEAVIRVCDSYGIKSSRIEGATGVWLDGGNVNARKICAIGVRSSHFVTMHGLAFNINTNLQYFNYINPCGFVDKGVTSIQKEIGKSVDISEVQYKLQENLYTLLYHSNNSNP